MMEKYYTPELSEFYIGFEYEYRYKTESRLCNICKGDLLTKENLKENCLHSGSFYTKESYEYKSQIFNLDVLYTIEDENIELRVKYLDKEDIESLGWKESVCKGVNCWNKTLFNLYFFNTTFISINELDICIFKGIIKNKSELKKLMQQLSII